MFKVSEVAEKLGVSKVSVYNRVNQNKEMFKPHLKKVKSVTYIDNKGFEMLKKLFSKDNSFTTLQDEVKTLYNEPETQDFSMYIEFKQVYEERINDLKEQVEELKKDKENMINQIGQLTELNRNAQILIKQNQDKVLLLESEKKPLLKRIFGKKEVNL